MNEMVEEFLRELDDLADKHGLWIEFKNGEAYLTDRDFNVVAGNFGLKDNNETYKCNIING